MPLLASDYLFRAILIPFLIMSLAAVGVNILVGYCGQISLGSGAFMAVGAYGGLQLLRARPRHAAAAGADPGRAVRHGCSASCSACPACACKGLYLAVATLAAQFFTDWMFLRIKWFTQRLALGLGGGVEPAGVRHAARQRR